MQQHRNAAQQYCQRTLGFWAFVCAMLAGVSLVYADVRMPAIFSDNMVLQAGVEAPIWGWADPGEEIEVDASWGEKVHGIAGKDGRWRVKLRTPHVEQSGFHSPEKETLQSVVITGKNTLRIENVFIGQVWVASGQSNMEMFVGYHNGAYSGVDDWQEEVAAADYPQIRFFTIANAVAAAPQDDCQGKWVVCSPKSVADFSAVAYFFAREISLQTGQPVGIIDADWGGTPAQAWTSAQGLASFPQYASGLELLRKIHQEPEAVEQEYQALLEEWNKKYTSEEQRVWAKPDFDASSWKEFAAPGIWKNDDLINYDGSVLCRIQVEIPASWIGQDLTLSLGVIDDNDITSFQGVQVGQTLGWDRLRMYTIPGKIVTSRKVTIGTNVIDTGGPGGMRSSPEQLYLVPKNGSEQERISLAGMWKYKIGKSIQELAQAPRRKSVTAYHPSSLYNGMIAPVVSYAIKGAIWYQGESNRGRAREYRTLFPAMIADWRSHWQQGDFSFYFVQISPFRYNGDTGQTALLREAQYGTMLHVPHTGMAVTMDIGNPGNIHPHNKQEVGRRLALWALAKDYGKDEIEYSGPLPKSVSVEGRHLRVRFSHADGLHAQGNPLKGFELADEKQVWHAAAATIEGDSVVLEASGVLTPVAARYGWDDDEEPNLFNNSNLPATPFRTTGWLALP